MLSKGAKAGIVVASVIVLAAVIVGVVLGLQSKSKKSPKKDAPTVKMPEIVLIGEPENSDECVNDVYENKPGTHLYTGLIHGHKIQMSSSMTEFECQGKSYVTKGPESSIEIISMSKKDWIEMLSYASLLIAETGQNSSCDGVFMLNPKRANKATPHYVEHPDTVKDGVERQAFYLPFDTTFSCFIEKANGTLEHSAKRQIINLDDDDGRIGMNEIRLQPMSEKELAQHEVVIVAGDLNAEYDGVYIAKSPNSFAYTQQTPKGMPFKTAVIVPGRKGIQLPDGMMIDKLSLHPMTRSEWKNQRYRQFVFYPWIHGNCNGLYLPLPNAELSGWYGRFDRDEKTLRAMMLMTPYSKHVKCVHPETNEILGRSAINNRFEKRHSKFWHGNNVLLFDFDKTQYIAVNGFEENSCNGVYARDKNSTGNYTHTGNGLKIQGLTPYSFQVRCYSKDGKAQRGDALDNALRPNVTFFESQNEAIDHFKVLELELGRRRGWKSLEPKTQDELKWLQRE